MDILTTPRLRLRVTLEGDIAPLHENVLGDAEVMRHAFGGAAMNRDEAEKFIRKISISTGRWWGSRH